MIINQDVDFFLSFMIVFRSLDKEVLIIALGFHVCRQLLLSRRKLLYPEMQALGRPFLAFRRKNDDDIA
jgi:hypothetical protein